MAGIFTVHGLSTPGVLQRGALEADAGLVVGVSGQLALWSAAVLFAIRYSPLADVLARRVSARALTAGVAVALLIYAVVGLAMPSAFGFLARLMLVTSGGSYGDTYSAGGYDTAPTSGVGYLPSVIVSSTVALYLYAACMQGREFLACRQPLQGALAAAFLLLAQAQLSQFLAPVWTLAWWEYHVLMLTVTALAERLEPEAVVDVLNAYLRAMASAVIADGGILDKFLGDGLMSIFGALDDGRSGAHAAAGAALRIRASVAALTALRTARGEITMAFGVGIHTGTVVLGAVGLPERSDYTAIGDTVNTASRMESLCKELQADIVLSSETAACLDGTGLALRPLGEVAVRGKAQPVRVFTLG